MTVIKSHNWKLDGTSASADLAKASGFIILKEITRLKYKSGTRRRALEYEKYWVQKWKDDKTFEKSVQNRSHDNSYVFYDGPPFISGNPHHGTLLSSIIKDIVPRYQTMNGKRVERVWGWDCHGLPAERFTEKKLGINSREEVIDYGIEKYILACRSNMVQTSGEWEDVVDRIGRWVDFKGAYKTMDKDYMESVWWAFKELYEKGKIYEGEKVLMYCTLDATPLSKAEVTMDAGAYQDVTDPSVYVKFKLEDGRVLLAWTTTPWTLPANTALAVNKNFDYVEVRVGEEEFVVAKELVDKVLTDEKHQRLDFQINREFKGQELLGKSYQNLLGVDRGENAHKVWHADYVETEAGTGIVHLAPAYGEEDFVLAKANGIPIVHTIDENGLFTEGEWAGQNVWEINKQIAKDLHSRGIVWKIDYIRHSYPHCHRCGTKLMYRAHPSWFMDIAGQRELMIEQNKPIYWFPEHVKSGRFQKTIEQAPDWNLSRDRFWATAMPVWKGKDSSGNDYIKVIGSYAELKELSGVELEDYHRPWVDDVKFTIDGVEYSRIDKVIDCWFESGSMPFAQFHYPFENKEKFEANFPGDFIVEYVGQVRAWFYYVHAVNVGLFGTHAFKNVIVTGNVAGNDGRKMSKSYGNYTDPNELMDKFSADSLRFLLASSPLLSGEDFALQDKEVGDVARKLSMIWNMYDFFTMYAEVDEWEWDGYTSDPSESLNNPLDIWVVSRLHQLQAEVKEYMDNYNLPDAMSPILPFIDDASNWYVRRSRRRFWKSEDDGDKADAYKTLHYVLTRLSVILAPFVPFMAEELYSKMTGLSESVHLQDWPALGKIDEEVITDMLRTRSIIEKGLSLRMQQDDFGSIKVRQPLQLVAYPSEKLGDFYEQVIAEEVNVKEVVNTPVAAGYGAKGGEPGLVSMAFEGSSLTIKKSLTPELKREGLVREVIRFVQNARKEAGLNVDDRIRLSLATDSEQLLLAIKEHEAAIKNETLAESVEYSASDASQLTDVNIDGLKLKMQLVKA
ncbi:isoleucine--tRNA ligase [Candidatus Saccharibacteria bacterium]|nr:MAG: isoleucine--tRNA ligase [Candidatus Saccharibacteria bacterium]